MGFLSPFAALVHGVPRLEPQIDAWTTNQLESVVWADVTGVDPEWFPVNRATAMQVPAMARARHLTAGTIAKLPLQCWRGSTELLPPAQSPTWLYASDGQLGDLADDVAASIGVYPQSTWQRMLWTIDDLLFYGECLWLVTSRAGGFPASLVRVPWSSWSWSTTGLLADAAGDPFDQIASADLLYIPGPHEGVLTYGARTLRQADTMERTASDVARRPFRLELHQTTEAVLDPVERHQIITETRQALADNNGVLFTNSAIETKDHPINSGDLLIAGRNQTALDVARDVSMPAAMIDAVATGASLEYQTALARNQQWIDYGLALYMDPVSARLSMDDVVPRGQRIAFDLTDLTSIDQRADEPPSIED